MKLRYKKTIFFISVGVMSIGLAALSMNSAVGSQQENDEEVMKVEENFMNQKIKAVMEKVASSTAVRVIKETPETVTGKAISSNSGEQELEKDAYPEINKLITKYLNAKLQGDKKTIQGIVNDINSIDMEKIKIQSEKIEKYNTIVCYTLLGPEKDSYIVYVYEELKIADIDTLVYGVDRFYICTDEKGKLYIYFGEIDDALMAEIQKADQNTQVQKLSKTVNDKMAERIKKDKDLQQYYFEMEEALKQLDTKQKDSSQK